MIGTEVIVEGGFLLDVFEGLDFSFNYSVSDIREPDTRQTEYTKTIKCPGTNNNNTLFGNLFEADIANPFDPNVDNIGVNFNPNKKAAVQVLRNSLPVLDGSMQLRRIYVVKGRIEYEVVFIGRLIDLFGAWGDKKMNEVDENGNHIIDLSDYDHLLTDTVQEASWSGTLGDGYIYPLIDYGRNSTLVDAIGQRTYPIIDLRPAVYVRTLWDKIFDLATATYEGDILNVTQSDGFDFDRLIIPWTAGFELSDEDIAEREVSAVRNSDKVMFSAATESFDMTNTTQDLLGQYDVSTDELTVAFTSRYQYSGVLIVTATRNLTGGASGVLPVVMELLKNGTPVSGYASDIDLTGVAAPVGETATTVIPFLFPEIDLAGGDVMTIRYVVDPVQLSVAANHDFVFKTGSAFNVKVMNEELAEGDLVRLNFGLPDMSIKDFFLSIVNMLNLYMVPDDSIPNKYHFYTRDQFYASGQIRDWTYKMDRGRSIEITPMGLLSGRENVYTYTEDGDYYNERYQNNYNRVYGSRRLDIDNDFVPKRNVTEVQFSATPLVNDGISARIIPKIWDSDISEGVNPADANTRILYYGGLLDGVVAWIHGTGGTSYTDYPYAGHWNNPITPTLDINFGLSLEYYYQANGATGAIQFTNNNLFKAYHERQFLEIASKDSKLITAMFDLTPLDIQQLDFRDTILIDQTYYRLNKVMNYNPFKVGLTKVELFKAGDIVYADAEVVEAGIGVPLGSGKMEEKAPLIKSKTLINGNQYEPFQGQVIGKNNVVSPSAVGFLVQGDNNKVGASSNVTLIGSNCTVANGVENVTAIGVDGITITESDTVISGVGGVQIAGVSIGSSDILTLGTTPVPFGLNVPTDTFPDVLTAKCFRPDVDTEYATNTVVAIRCVGADDPLFTLDFLGKTTTGTGAFFMERYVSTNVNNKQIIPNTDLEVYVVGGDPTGGTFNMELGITFAYTPA